MLLIEFSPEKFRNRQKCAATMNIMKVNFIPGISDYNRGNWQEIMDHEIHGPVVSKYLDSGILRVIQNSKSEESGLLGGSIDKALSVIEETTSMELLKKFAVEVEGNVELAAAINLQIEKLTPSKAEKK